MKKKKVTEKRVKKVMETIVRTGTNRVKPVLLGVEPHRWGALFSSLLTLPSRSCCCCFWDLMRSSSATELRLWIDDRTVGDERRSDD
uniref:Uncharacterized protein MANES_18G075500 n=1 Tax=Rhizophora mucronata TaxID=61149 RepID=A0A2P2JI25_RHIMU